VRLLAAPARGDAPDDATPLAVPAASGKGRVLIVDDNQYGAELLADSLRALGYTTAVAFDGPSALQKAPLFMPDVVLLDLGLPVMDGFELAERLRNDCGLTRVPLVAITGYAQEVDRQRTAANGFQGHLAKPVDVHVVDELIREIQRDAIEAG
jgi:two-component system CheB/CheR fusion protein